MSMSTSVYGFAPPDATWIKMKKIWDACEEAGIAIPDDVGKFFGYETPDPAGVEVDLKKCGCAVEYSDEYRMGYQIDVDKIPSHVKTIRVVNSW